LFTGKWQRHTNGKKNEITKGTETCAVLKTENGKLIFISLLVPEDETNKSNKLLLAEVRKWLLTYVKINANIEKHLTRSSLLALNCVGLQNLTNRILKMGLNKNQFVNVNRKIQVLWCCKRAHAYFTDVKFTELLHKPIGKV